MRARTKKRAKKGVDKWGKKDPTGEKRPKEKSGEKGKRVESSPSFLVKNSPPWRHDLGDPDFGRAIEGRWRVGKDKDGTHWYSQLSKQATREKKEGVE